MYTRRSRQLACPTTQSSKLRVSSPVYKSTTFIDGFSTHPVLQIEAPRLAQDDRKAYCESKNIHPTAYPTTAMPSTLRYTRGEEARRYSRVHSVIPKSARTRQQIVLAQEESRLTKFRVLASATSISGEAFQGRIETTPLGSKSHTGMRMCTHFRRTCQESRETTNQYSSATPRLSLLLSLYQIYKYI